MSELFELTRVFGEIMFLNKGVLVFGLEIITKLILRKIST